MTRHGWFVLLVGMVFAGHAHAQVDVERSVVRRGNRDFSQRWAVIIGVNEYLDTRVRNLRYCVSDAHLLNDTLVQYCGYDADNVLLITDRQQKAHLRPMKRNLTTQVRDWLSYPGEEDTVLVYFSGHGFIDRAAQGYLAPQDCDRDALIKTALRTQELRDMLNECKAKQKILILDCCHAGAAKGDEGTEAVSNPTLSKVFEDAKGLMTIASCTSNEKSQEWSTLKHGLFTYFLAEGLRGSADRDGDRIVDADELYRYTYQKVRTTAQRELNLRQTPWRQISPDMIGIPALAVIRNQTRRPGKVADDKGEMVTHVVVSSPTAEVEFQNRVVSRPVRETKLVVKEKRGAWYSVYTDSDKKDWGWIHRDDVRELSEF
ncbi:Caspase domain protein [Planctomycetes bacterium Pan216]|uniref:Caspase domain protein n=1 Tax=Kolteria novifilia TaxID=2527975 RepID=A0A518B3G7_9BACT|nr:Caspase domain protein [Planctomycetes bacterium Pan216]